MRSSGTTAQLQHRDEGSGSDDDDMRQDGDMHAGAASVDATSHREMTSLEAIGARAPVALHTFASQLASAVSTAALYPFDVLRTRYVAQDGTLHRAHNGHTYTSVPRALRAIVRDEGARALFRGCSVAVVGATVAWGLYMSLYRALCNASEVTSYVGRSGVSVLASLASSLAMSPVFMLKSRMQLEEVRVAATNAAAAGAAQTTAPHHGSGHSAARPYGRFCRGLAHAVRSGGVRSLWCGASLQLLLVFPNALSLPTYDYLKSQLLSHDVVSWWRHHRHRRQHATWPTVASNTTVTTATTTTAAATRDLTLVEVCVCTTLTRLLVLALSHPLMMTRVRMQDHRGATAPLQYRRVVQSMSLTVKTQGVCGLYRGFSTSLLHSFPRALLHYVVYERSLNYLCRYSYWHATPART